MKLLSVITLATSVLILGACATNPLQPIQVDIESPSQAPDCTTQDDPTCPVESFPPDTTPACPGGQDSPNCQTPPPTGPPETFPCDQQDPCSQDD